jgi:hypothetical protein
MPIAGQIVVMVSSHHFDREYEILASVFTKITEKLLVFLQADCRLRLAKKLWRKSFARNLELFAENRHSARPPPAKHRRH